MVSEQVRHKSGCTVTDAGYRLEISDLRRRVNVTIRVAKVKALISFCVFVFAYVDCWFSHEATLSVKYGLFEKSNKMIAPITHGRKIMSSSYMHLERTLRNLAHAINRDFFSFKNCIFSADFFFF